MTNGPPVVSVSAADPLAVFATTNYGSFLFTRAGDTDSPVMVNFGLGGTAVNWRDYRTTMDDPVPPFITIPAGAVSNVLTIVALTNSTGFNPETVVLTLSGGTAYSVASPASATITLVNLASQITSLQPAEPGGITIRWTSVPGFVYRVMYKDELTGPDWRDLSGDITATSTITSWTDYPVSAPRRFYIVQGEPPVSVQIVSLAPVSILGGGNGMKLNWTGLSGQTYHVMFKNNLTDAEWSDLSGPIIARATMVSWTDFLTPGVPRRFYQIYQGR